MWVVVVIVIIVSHGGPNREAKSGCGRAQQRCVCVCWRRAPPAQSHRHRQGVVIRVRGRSGREADREGWFGRFLGRFWGGGTGERQKCFFGVVVVVKGTGKDGPLLGVKRQAPEFIRAGGSRTERNQGKKHARWWWWWYKSRKGPDEQARGAHPPVPSPQRPGRSVKPHRHRHRRRHRRHPGGQKLVATLAPDSRSHATVARPAAMQAKEPSTESPTTTSSSDHTPRQYWLLWGVVCCFFCMLLWRWCR